MSHVPAILLAAAAFLSVAVSRAASPGLEFNAAILDFKAYQRDEATGRYLGPTGTVLQIREESIAEPGLVKKLLKGRLLQLKMLFEPHGAPYPGMLTKEASCARSAMLPEGMKEDGSSLYWFSEMPATQGLVYGSCGAMEEPYWSQQLLLFCKAQHVLYDVRWFKVRSRLGEKIGKPIASCLSPHA